MSSDSASQAASQSSSSDNPQRDQNAPPSDMSSTSTEQDASQSASSDNPQRDQIAPPSDMSSTSTGQDASRSTTPADESTRSYDSDFPHLTAKIPRKRDQAQVIWANKTRVQQSVPPCNPSAFLGQDVTPGFSGVWQGASQVISWSNPQLEQSTLPGYTSSANPMQDASQLIESQRPQVDQSILEHASQPTSPDKQQVDQSNLLSDMISSNESQEASQLASSSNPQVQNTLMSSANVTQDASRLASTCRLQVDRSSLPIDMGSGSPSSDHDSRTDGAASSFIQFDGHYSGQNVNKSLGAKFNHHEQTRDPCDEFDSLHQAIDAELDRTSLSPSRDQDGRTDGAAGSSIQFDRDCYEQNVNESLDAKVDHHEQTRDPRDEFHFLLQAIVQQLDRTSLSPSRDQDRRTDGAAGSSIQFHRDYYEQNVNEWLDAKVDHHEQTRDPRDGFHFLLQSIVQQLDRTSLSPSRDHGRRNDSLHQAIVPQLDRTSLTPGFEWNTVVRPSYDNYRGVGGMHADGYGSVMPHANLRPETSPFARRQIPPVDRQNSVQSVPTYSHIPPMPDPSARFLSPFLNVENPVGSSSAVEAGPSGSSTVGAGGYTAPEGNFLIERLRESHLARPSFGNLQRPRPPKLSLHNMPVHSPILDLHYGGIFSYPPPPPPGKPSRCKLCGGDLTSEPEGNISFDRCYHDSCLRSPYEA